MKFLEVERWVRVNMDAAIFSNSHQTWDTNWRFCGSLDSLLLLMKVRTRSSGFRSVMSNRGNS